MSPRLAIPMNLSVRASSKVLLVPKRVDTSDCTRGSAWSSKALNPSSDLAKAKVCLPVVRLVFMGGMTPTPLSSSANLGLLISSFFVTPEAVMRSSLACLVISRCFSSIGRSRSSIGSVNIRRVRSIIRSSCFGKSLPIMENNLYVSSTSLTQ